MKRWCAFAGAAYHIGQTGYLGPAAGAVLSAEHCLASLDLCVHWMYTSGIRCSDGANPSEAVMKSQRTASATRSTKRRPAPPARVVPARAAARDVRFTARLAHGDKALLQRAAAGLGQTLSAYVFEKARAAAIAQLEAAGEIVLASADQRRFVQLLLAPPAPNARLRRAIQAAESAASRG